MISVRMKTHMPSLPAANWCSAESKWWATYDGWSASCPPGEKGTGEFYARSTPQGRSGKRSLSPFPRATGRSEFVELRDSAMG